MCEKAGFNPYEFLNPSEQSTRARILYYIAFEELLSVKTIIKQQAEEISKLRNALEFYADLELYEKRGAIRSGFEISHYPKIDKDMGSTARKALKKE